MILILNPKSDNCRRLAAGILYPVFHQVLVTPAMAAAFMAMSSISVVTNSLLMKRSRIK
ncbi:MAG: hypothetical protein K8R11_02080 [Methanococcoides sp.]|nr:hypothetical protein [Methanococcoides sp.]